MENDWILRVRFARGDYVGVGRGIPSPGWVARRIGFDSAGVISSKPGHGL